VNAVTGRMALVVLGLLLVLTYLLLRGSTPDATLHDRRLRAIDALTLDQAALQRDVLRASHGLLLNYDPLVAAVTRLRRVAEELRDAGAASGAPGALMNSIASGLDEQETLVEDFKSAHALLQNSLTYFAHLSRRLATSTSQAGQNVALVVGRLTNSMSRFVGASSDAAEAAEVAALLDKLSILAAPAGLRGDIAALRAHGGLILSTLPAVDGIQARLLAMRISEQARVLQNLFIDEHRHAETLAWIFRVLLYLTSVLLLIYLSYLYMRLGANARTLKARSDFEHLIARISAELIDTPLDRTEHGVRQGLEQLGRHAGVDRVYVILHGADDAVDAQSHSWFREGIDVPAGWPDGALAIGSTWGPEGYERHGCIDVPSVQTLLRSEERSKLTERGIRSWLCVPLWHAGDRVGLLGFDAVKVEKRWADDDIALLRTIGEVFASALGREQAEREKQALESRLRHAQRIEALGTLAGGIAHDFNNILAAILGYTEMALDRLRRDSPEWKHVQEVRKAGERARDIVDRILAFSRRTEQRHRPVRMRPLLEETSGLLGASLPPAVTLRMRLPDEDAVVLGEPSRLQQVVMNLCTNAAQAMEGQGAIEVALDLVALDAERALSHGALAAGRYVRLTVSDSGHGMDAATLERIFEPFFTTKAVGTGTGLGLAMVHGIVADHGGAIDVRSTPGAGSSFAAYFRQAEALPTDDDRSEAPVPRGRGQTILFVDDEKPLVLLGEEMLAAIGYEPIGFDNSSAALAAFRADPDRFDLVLTDEIMPEMTGTELAIALHEIRPDLPIILMTGYTGHIPSQRLEAAGISDVLKKPLLSSPISFCLARHLARGREMVGDGVS
jgi:signal transduction histidine kinase/ActR/RegA family two-component response regulator